MVIHFEQQTILSSNFVKLYIFSKIVTVTVLNAKPFNLNNDGGLAHLLRASGPDMCRAKLLTTSTVRSFKS